MGSTVRLLREAQNLSQSQLAEAVLKHNGKAGTQYISDIESGRRKPNGDDLLAALAAALQVDADYLYFSAGKLCPSLVSVELERTAIGEAIDAFKRVAERSRIQSRTTAASSKYDLRYSHTALEAIYTGRLPVAFGTYLNSLGGSSTNPPAWQVALQDEIRRELEHLGREVKTGFRLEMYEGVPSGDGRAFDGLNMEFMIDTAARRRDTEIDPIGYVESLALVFIEGATVAGSIEELPSNWFDVIGKKDKSIPICAMRGHAPDDLLNAAVMLKQIVPQVKTERENAGRLFAWLREHADDGVLACDWGVAKPLKADAKKIGVELGLKKVPYPQPLQVGFAVPRNDDQWLKFIREKRVEVTRQDPQSWQETVTLMAALEIMPMLNDEPF